MSEPVTSTFLHTNVFIFDYVFFTTFHVLTFILWGSCSALSLHLAFYTFLFHSPSPPSVETSAEVFKNLIDSTRTSHFFAS